MIKHLRFGWFCLLIALIGLNPAFAQQITDTSSARADCAEAKKIVVTGPRRIEYKKAPSGGGKNEIRVNASNGGYAFEKEHNSSWHQLAFKVDGNLCFTIRPLKKDDDYDFMLFTQQDSNACDYIRNSKPIRANISRDKEELEGITGLKATATSELIKQGVRDAYSKSLPVKKGDTYLLAIDNVYEQGEGFILDIFFEKAVVLRGQLVDENNKGLKGEVRITNAAGAEVAKAETDSLTGLYKLNVLLREKNKYTVHYYSPDHFFFTRQFTVDDTLVTRPQIQSLATLKKGSKQSVGAINFFPDQDVYVKASEPALKNLVRMLKTKEQLKIKIIGHTNGCGPSNYKGGSKGLSKGRAEAIKRFLEENGIAVKERVITDGRDCQDMLYPENGLPWQQEANRRVEVEILEN